MESVEDYNIEITPYGIDALLISMGNVVDRRTNNLVHLLDTHINAQLSEFVIFSIPAYCSLTVGYDRALIEFSSLKTKLQGLISTIKTDSTEKETVLLNIPVCYDDFDMDMQEVSNQTGLSRDRIIDLHVSTTYQVFMMGFLPGFAYMGKSPEILRTTRKASPRQKVLRGSVGLAGLQSGVYPSEAPGGWQIIGNTPIPLYRLKNQANFLFCPGDRVKFFSISKTEHLRLTNKYKDQPINRLNFIDSE